MRLQLISDLHLETERFTPEPAPSAELLVIAGDLDSSWKSLELFAGWPVPVLFVAGNHEFDRRELTEAWPALDAACRRHGIELIERRSVVKVGDDGRRVRFVGTVRWCDFDLFGPSARDKAMRAAGYFQKVMQATNRGLTFDAAEVRKEALECGGWLRRALQRPHDEEAPIDATVVVTHYGPSMKSADPRYGRQPGTASFLNADDALLPLADLWLHGHVHLRHDYLVPHDGGTTRVVCNARGHTARGEAESYDGSLVLEV